MASLVRAPSIVHVSYLKVLKEQSVPRVEFSWCLWLEIFMKTRLLAWQGRERLGHLGKVCSWLKEEEPFLSVEEEAKLSGRAAIV